MIGQLSISSEHGVHKNLTTNASHFAKLAVLNLNKFEMFFRYANVSFLINEISIIIIQITTHIKNL